MTQVAEVVDRHVKYLLQGLQRCNGIVIAELGCCGHVTLTLVLTIRRGVNDIKSDQSRELVGQARAQGQCGQRPDQGHEFTYPLGPLGSRPPIVYLTPP